MTRKTKIVCTLGPATDAEGVLRDMILAGMNVARFNFSHGTHAEHLVRLQQLTALREEMDLPIATLLDTRGPEVRLGRFKGDSITVQTGDILTLTPHDIEGTQNKVHVTFSNLYQDVVPGAIILVDDGKIEMQVQSIEGDDVVCEILNNGVISNQKSINIPGVHLSIAYLSPQDKEDLAFGAIHGFDFFAASFTRNARDVRDIRQFLAEHDCKNTKIIAKIESQSGVDNIDEILAVSNGIMIARGDMGVEIDFTEIPSIQKSLIAHCYSSGRPAITATQMLESMMQNPRPTRAEITDVANAIYDGTSAIMLSGETAAGQYPVEAVRTMAAIAERTESSMPYHKLFKDRMQSDERLTVTEAVAHATCTTAMDIGASAIITVTQSGETARHLCKYRPSTPIIACVMNPQVYRQLALSWGITPAIMPFAKDTDEMISASVRTAQERNLVQDGDLVVITAGVPVGIPGTTNLMKAHLVGESLLNGLGVGKRNAIGRVCICYSAADAASKFKPGDVLVINSTSNEILDAMRTASAIITEEPGMNSHAAIVGLALSKPVIVGATSAVQKLQDGQLVTVDAERGIVRSMPE